MLKPTLFLCTVFLSSLAIAQRANTYFFTNDGTRVSTRDSADFIRIVSEPDSASLLYNVADFYKTGQKKLVAKSSKIDPPSFEGTCITFYRNGHKESIKNYYLNIDTGLEYDYYQNGKLAIVKKHPDLTDRLSYKSLSHDFLIMENYDSLGTQLVSNGNGYYKGFQTNGVDEGPIKDGKMNGEWKGKVSFLNISIVEKYEDGVFISGVAKDSLGVTTEYKTRETVPEFKSGLEGFYKYVTENIQYFGDPRQPNIQGRVVLSFVIEKDGSLSNIKVVISVSKSIDAEALRVMKHCPKWVPGKQFGQNVRCAYTIPIVFK